jgi:hypothetical protein
MHTKRLYSQLGVLANPNKLFEVFETSRGEYVNFFVKLRRVSIDKAMQTEVVFELRLVIEENWFSAQM